MRFYEESIRQITQELREQLEKEPRVVFEVLNPDLFPGKYAGERVEVGDSRYLYRGYKAWTDLAEVLQCRMLTPNIVDATHVCLHFERLDREDSFHKATRGKEKYGVDSEFFRIHKNEEPAFVHYLQQALHHVRIAERKRVLDLGINGADEFELIKASVEDACFQQMELVGIDYSASAISYAQQRFPQKNVSLLEHDINELHRLHLGRFDLILSIGTFQSPNIDFKPFFMSLVQEYLHPNGAMILGFPNCRWMDGEMVYGAKVPNYAFSEMGMLYSDVMFCKKYLQQKKFRVTLTGKNYIFLTATKIGSLS